MFGTRRTQKHRLFLKPQSSGCQMFMWKWFNPFESGELCPQQLQHNEAGKAGLWAALTLGGHSGRCIIICHPCIFYTSLQSVGLEQQCNCDMAAPDLWHQKPWSTKLFSFQADACDLLIEVSHIPLPSSLFYIRTDSGKARSSQWNAMKGLLVTSWEDNESLLLDAQDRACCLIAMMLWTKYWLFNGVLWLFNPFRNPLYL